MAVVALSDAEKITLRNDQTLINTFKQKIIAKAAYFMGVTSGDVTWGRSRYWAAHIEHNPSALHDDQSLGDLLQFKMSIRAFQNKDDAGGGTLSAQVIAYLNGGTPVRFDYLVDDYFAEKTESIQF